MRSRKADCHYKIRVFGKFQLTTANLTLTVPQALTMPTHGNTAGLGYYLDIPICYSTK